MYNPGQNIWNKMKKLREIGQSQKTLIAAFAYFFTATAKVSFFE